jgi:hypothetical protein
MVRKTCVILISFLLFTSMATAKEAKTPEITKIERVRWSGLSLGWWRIFGNWATVPEGQVTLFGSNSPYFRLNGNDRTVFRGLGRESNLVQRILPTLHSKSKLQEIIGSNEMARQSLIKYDVQVAAGEKLSVVSGGLSFGGKMGITAGLVMMFLGFSDTNALEAGEMPGIAKTGYTVGVIGIAMWAIGQVGEIAGEFVSKQAFSHLYDSMEYYNKEQAKNPSHSQVLLSDRF